jgi:hypothetical protein
MAEFTHLNGIVLEVDGDVPGSIGRSNELNGGDIKVIVVWTFSGNGIAIFLQTSNANICGCPPGDGIELATGLGEDAHIVYDRGWDADYNNSVFLVVGSAAEGKGSTDDGEELE